jgi:hypothetical protein
MDSNSRDTGFWELGGAADAECRKRVSNSPEGRGTRNDGFGMKNARPAPETKPNVGITAMNKTG